METFRLLLQYLITPTIIAAALGWTLKKVIDSWITGSLKKYEIQLQADLESHKAKIKSEYDLRHFEFQQRFSRLHQKQAEVTETLFELLAIFFNSLQELSAWENQERSQQYIGALPRNKHEFVLKTREQLKELGAFYDKKRVYLETDVQQNTFHMIRMGWMILSEDLSSEMMTEPLRNLMDSEVLPIMVKLEKSFKAFLTATGKSEQNTVLPVHRY